MKKPDIRTKILITGGTGLLGEALIAHLSEKGYDISILSRRKVTYPEIKVYQWDVSSGEIDSEALEVDHIIHLAGAGVADQRWTDNRKKVLYDSRILSTRFLFEQLKKQTQKPKSIICASAIGIYGVDSGDDVMSESNEPGNGFLANLVKDWELEADRFQEIGLRSNKIRIGIVLSEKGGALPKIMLPVRFGFGAAIGTGKQYLSWVHIDDLCRIFEHAIEGHLEGAVNAVAPNPVSNKDFNKAVARFLHRPLILPNVPAFLLKLMLGEMSSIVIGGNNVSGKKLIDSGFDFKFKELSTALENLK